MFSKCTLAPVAPKDGYQKPTEEVQILSGIIRGKDKELLAGVTVRLPDFGQNKSTDQYGKYKFEVTAKKQETVNITAKKAGYEIYDGYATLGNSTHNFTMGRKL